MNTRWKLRVQDNFIYYSKLTKISIGKIIIKIRFQALWNLEVEMRNAQNMRIRTSATSFSAFNQPLSSANWYRYCFKL